MSTKSRAVQAYESGRDAKQGLVRTLQLLEQIHRKGQPEDPSLLGVWSTLEAVKKHIDSTNATLEKIVEKLA